MRLRTLRGASAFPASSEFDVLSNTFHLSGDWWPLSASRAQISLSRMEGGFRKRNGQLFRVCQAISACKWLDSLFDDWLVVR